MNKNLVSKIDSKITLEYILNAKESIIFERKWIFKPNWDIDLKPTKVAETIIWMLNADWWTFVLWVRDWEIEDLNKLDNIKLNDYKQVVLDYISPACNIEIEDFFVDGKLILIYHIDPDRERVFFRKDNEEVFLRNWDENRKLDRNWVRKLEYDKSIRKFEEEKRWDFIESDFRKSIIEYYKTKINYQKDYNELLVNRNLAVKDNGNYIYKNSAILLFAEDPEKYIASSSVRYIRYSWNKLETWGNFNIIKDEMFYWWIPILIEILKRFLKNVFRDYYYLDISSWKFVKISEYPEEAWLEWIVNALTHRSYNLQWNVTYIKHFDDRLEISNPWPLPASVTVENIRETRFSRNKRIARVLIEMWYVRELNEWVNRIYDSMKKALLAEPIYINKNDTVTLILKNNISKNEDTISEKTMKNIEKIFTEINETQKDIVSILIINKKLNLNELAKKVKISPRTLRWYLKSLIEKEIIVKISYKDKKRDINALYQIKK